MSNLTPTVFALEVDSAWVVILAVSFVTLAATMLLRRVITRPGGLSSGLLLSLPLWLPLVAAFIYQRAVLPEVTVLQPVRVALSQKPDELLHFLFLSSDGRTWVAYAFSGTARTWIFIVGAGLSSIMLIRRLVGAVILQRVLARCRPIAASDRARLRGMVYDLSRQAGLGRPPEVLLLPAGVSGAFAAGTARRRILISRDLLDELDEDELAAVLAHEIAHLEARDVPLVFVAGFLRDFVAWNPFAHFAFRRLLRDREMEADKRAVLMTEAPLALASGLIKVLELTRRHRFSAQRGALALIKPRSRVGYRVNHLLALADGTVAAAPVRRGAFVASAALVAVLGLQAGARLASQDSALAFVWGGPAPTTLRTWEPAARQGGAAKQVSQKERRKQRKAEQTGGTLEGLIKTPALRNNLQIRTRDMGTVTQMFYRRAHRLGIPVSEFQLQARPVSVLGSRSFGVYRLDEQFFGKTRPQ